MDRRNARRVLASDPACRGCQGLPTTYDMSSMFWGLIQDPWVRHQPSVYCSGHLVNCHRNRELENHAFHLHRRLLHGFITELHVTRNQPVRGNHPDYSFNHGRFCFRSRIHGNRPCNIGTNGKREMDIRFHF